MGDGERGEGEDGCLLILELCVCTSGWYSSLPTSLGLGIFRFNRFNKRKLLPI